MQDLLIEHCESILLFAFLSAASLWIANSFGYFQLPNSRDVTTPKVTFFQVFCIFGIYLGTLVIVGGSIARLVNLLLNSLLDKDLLYSPYYAPLFSSFVQLIVTFLAGFFLVLFCKAQKDRASMLAIWKEPNSRVPITKDMAFGMATWVISFPIVLLVGELFDFFVFLTFGPQQYEQVAVHYLKMSLSSSILFAIALFTVVIAAPILEELLFRGFLLNFLKRYLGRMASILLTSIAFALFHFSLSQKLGNIPLVGSLFSLALFLGFIYERQRSLFASISLHMTFNIISVVRILFSP